jgi:ATP-dependent Clp protease protease subunit
MPSADAARLRGLTESLILDDTRIENILKTHLKIPEDRWSVHPFQDLVFDAPQAKQYGLIEEIRDFDIPAGTQLFNIN